MPEFNSKDEWKSLRKLVTSLIKEYDNFTRFNISGVYEDWIGKIFFFLFLLPFCRGKMKVPGPHSWLLDTMCHYRNRKCWLSLQVRNRQLTQKKTFEISATEAERNICFSRGCSSLNGAHNLKVNIKSIPDVFMLTFGSPLQKVLKHYQFQLSSWTVFCEADISPFQTASEADSPGTNHHLLRFLGTHGLKVPARSKLSTIWQGIFCKASYQLDHSVGYIIYAQCADRA